MSDDFEKARKPCTNCGRVLHTGEGKVTIALTAGELYSAIEVIKAADCADSMASPAWRVKEAMLCALGLLDHDLAEALK